MIIAGIKRLDRVRGSGWLDCPNCHEHSQHDIVDDMRFASMANLGTAGAAFRHFPLFRIRRLKCRRCDFESPPRVPVPAAVDRIEMAIGTVSMFDYFTALWLLVTAETASALEYLLLSTLGFLALGFLERGVRPLRAIAFGWIAIRALAQVALIVSVLGAGGGFALALLMAVAVGIPLAAALAFTVAGGGPARDYIGQMAGRPTRPPADEMEKLETVGQPIGRAWMFPVGGVVQVAFYFVCIAVVGVSGTTLGGKAITFVPHSGQEVIPSMTMDVPSDWNFEADSQGPDQCAQYPCVISSQIGSFNSIILERDTLHTNINDLVLVHFQDQRNFQSSNFPSAPPKGTCTTVAGVPAYKYVIDWTLSGSAGRNVVYVFVHAHVGYVLVFTATGSDTINTLPAFAEHVAQSIKFSGNDTGPTPNGVSTASPTPFPSETASSSSSPAATPSLGPVSAQSAAATAGAGTSGPISCGS